MACTCILLDRLEHNSPQVAIFDLCDLLCGRMVDDVVFHLDRLPVLADASRANLCDATLTSEDLIVDHNHVLLLLFELQTKVMLKLPIEDNPVIAELVEEHFAEVGDL